MAEEPANTEDQVVQDPNLDLDMNDLDEDAPDSADAASDALPPVDPNSWSQIWHLPVLLLGVFFFSVGLYLALPEKEQHDFAGVLASANQALKKGDFGRAQIELDKAQSNLHEAKPIAQGQFWLLSGDRIYLQQLANQSNIATNHENVLKYYVRAKQMKVPIDIDHLERWAQTLMALDRSEEALGMLDQMKDEPASRRYGLIKKVILHKQAQRRTEPEDLVPLLARFESALRRETDQQARFLESVWFAQVKSENLLRAGQPYEQMGFLTKKIQRLRAQGQEKVLAPLFLLLAKGYQQTGEYDSARRYFMYTQKLISQTDALNSQVLVGLGQLALAGSDDAELALSLFEQAVKQYPNEPSYLDALLGLGDSAAKLGRHAQAREYLGRAVKRLAKPTMRHDPRRQLLYGTASAHYSLNYDQGEYEHALDYLELVKPLFPDQLPGDMLVRLAVTHERIAENKMEVARTFKNLAGQTKVSKRLTGQQRGLAFQESALHYQKAGQYFLMHAIAVTIEDDQAHGNSLWKSAESYDKAQLWDKSIEVYSQFVKTRASDQRYLRAIYRLGLAFQAEGQYQAAMEKFMFLIEHKPKSLPALESYVPLARSHLALGQYEPAQKLLEYVVEDHPTIEPMSMQYRDALIALGRLHYQQKHYPQAISRFDTAVERYGQTKHGPMLYYYLADANRKSVELINDKLATPLPQSVELALQKERIDRLRKAKDLYKRVIAATDKSDHVLDNALETLSLRNAYLYRADCAYQLKNWDEANQLYDAAAKRWEKDPISLVALIQIVNVYAEQGRVREAKTANQRARFQLNKIPDEAFQGDTLPLLTRSYWENWLKWESELGLNEVQSGTPGPGNS